MLRAACHLAELTESGYVKARRPLEEVVASGINRGGVLLMPNARREAVFLQFIPSARWAIATHENTACVQRELAEMRRNMIGGFLLLGLLIAFPSAHAARRISSRYEKIIEDRNQRTQEEQAVSEKLLLNILPTAIAAELKSDREVIAQRHEEVSILFADLVGFTRMATRIQPERLVQILNEIFPTFDDLAEARGLEKIKTIGDSYMVCGNFPEPQSDHQAAMRYEDFQYPLPHEPPTSTSPALQRHCHRSRERRPEGRRRPSRARPFAMDFAWRGGWPRSPWSLLWLTRIARRAPRESASRSCPGINWWPPDS